MLQERTRAAYANQNPFHTLSSSCAEECQVGRLPFFFDRISSLFPVQVISIFFSVQSFHSPARFRLLAIVL